MTFDDLELRASSDALDLDELGLCLRALQEAASAARAELAEISSLIDEARARLGQLRDAVALMKRLEQEQVRDLEAEMMTVD